MKDQRLLIPRVIILLIITACIFAMLGYLLAPQVNSSLVPTAVFTTTIPTLQPTVASFPSPVDMPNKTYTNTLYGYQLQYPTTWEVSAKGNENPAQAASINFSSPCNYDAGDLCQQFTIDTMQKATSGKSLTQLINEKFDPTIQGAKSKVISNKAVTIGDDTWQEVIFYASNGGNSNDTTYDYVHTYLFMIQYGVLITVDYTESQKGLIQAPDTFTFKKKDQFVEIMKTFDFTT